MGILIAMALAVPLIGVVGDIYVVLLNRYAKMDSACRRFLDLLSCVRTNMVLLGRESFVAWTQTVQLELNIAEMTAASMTRQSEKQQ